MAKRERWGVGILYQGVLGASIICLALLSGCGSSGSGSGGPAVEEAPLASEPVINAIDPAEGPFLGGTVVTISGAHLGETRQVTFGGTPGRDLVVRDDSTITCTAPSWGGTLGPVDIVVTTPSGTASLSGGFTFYDPVVRTPTVGSVDPSRGPAAGGTIVTINGQNLTTVSEVTFGGVTSSDLLVMNDTTLRVTTPAWPGEPGAVDVVVTTSGGVTTIPGGFTYLDLFPEITSLQWTLSSSGDVTITWEATGPADEIVVYRGRSPLATLTADARTYTYRESAFGIFRLTVALYLREERAAERDLIVDVGRVLWDGPETPSDGYYIYVAQESNPLPFGAQYSYDARTSRKVPLKNLYDADIIQAGLSYRLAVSSRLGSDISELSETVQFTYEAVTARP